MSERGVSRKLGPAEVLVAVFVGLLVLAVVGPAAQKLRLDAYRDVCANNLSLIGKAIQVYAGDHDGQFPRSGSRSADWTTTLYAWNTPDRYRAFGMARDGTGGKATVSSCLYLLVKYADVAPSTFVCPGDAGAAVFDPVAAGAGDKELSELWDFGPDAANHCSYAYHSPFELYALSTAAPLGVAVAADRNPWFMSPAGPAKDFAKFNPDGDREAIKAGNSASHQNEGQNVLFLDGHVAFKEEPFCGVNKDNIYTFGDGGDVRRGGLPVYPLYSSEPRDRTDSFLLNEPGVYRATTTSQPKAVNSTALKQTAIAATLDCPMPEHKNVIWCGTFQIAWDKFKNDIIKESVQLKGAEALADRLNRGEFSRENMEEKSYYAAAGFVKDGIIEEIQKEMAKRFPSEPKPEFDRRYRTFLEASAAYCFLSVDVSFPFPFYVYNPFEFEASDGTRTDVTAFSSETGGRDSDSWRVREQVEILYYKYADQGSGQEFAVDLCKHTEPYQVVLACMARREPLNESLKQIERDISDFRLDPDYEELRQLRPIDKLIVPDVLYKLTHHFKDLEEKGLSNPKWRERLYYIFDARQMIHFSLSRTGVILKSQALIGGASAGIAMPPKELPRYFYFNRPFLIYVKKRGAEFSPFFVMWVDNAELMKEF